MATRNKIGDVAKAAGVSIKTVSRVLNKERYVREATRVKVEAVMASLAFSPSRAARALRGNRSFQIALIYDNHSPYYIHAVQEGVWGRCREEGVRLLAQPVDVSSAALRAEVAGLVDETHIDGVILSSPVTDAPEVLAELEARGIPFVRISPGTEVMRASSVSMHDMRAAEDMTAHLIGLGHRRIGFVLGDPNHLASEARHRGYRNALAIHRIDYDDGLVQPGNFDFESGVQAAGVLLDASRRPTAIFASNDDMAAGVLSVAHRKGLRLPEDLSVAGFDDTPLAQLVWPPLTTIRQPTRDMAYAAAGLLFDAPGEIVHRSLDYALIIRASVAQPGRRLTAAA